MKNIQFSDVELKSASYYVRRAFKEYDCGLITMNEFVHHINEINEYSQMKQELEGLYAKIYDSEERLNRI